MKIEIQNSQLEQKLEQKINFLTLEYISILDNAIKDCLGGEELKNKDGEDRDIFGTLHFITNFINKSDNEKRKFLEKLNSDLFIQVNCEKLDVPSDSCVDNEDNFYILYANIYSLRQKIVHIEDRKLQETNKKPSIEEPSKNQDSKEEAEDQKTDKKNPVKKLLKNIESQPIISHYKYLFLALPISFSYHLKNLFWAEYYKAQKLVEEANKEPKKTQDEISQLTKKNLNEIEGFIEFSKENFNDFFKGEKCTTNSSLNDNKSGIAKVKFIRNISINKSRKNLKAPNDSKMKFNFIGEKNYKDLQNLIKKINQNYPYKDKRNNNKNDINQKMFFEEIERIYELIIEINVLFRIHFTRFYNIEKPKNEDLEKRIKNLNGISNDQLCEKSKNIFEDMKKISYSPANYNQLIKILKNASEKKLTKRVPIKKKIDKFITDVESAPEYLRALKIQKLRNNIDHSNFFGIFQTSKNKHFSLKNFQENFNNIEKFLQNFSNNSPDDSGDKPDFLSFRNQLIQALSKKNYFLIKSQYHNDIKLHRVGLDHQKIISRKKSNKKKIIDVIQKHKRDREDEKFKKYSKKSKKQKLEFRLIKFFNYAEFKTTLIKKGLKKIELNKVKI